MGGRDQGGGRGRGHKGDKETAVQDLGQHARDDVGHPRRRHEAAREYPLCLQIEPLHHRG